MDTIFQKKNVEFFPSPEYQLSDQFCAVLLKLASILLLSTVDGDVLYV